jgi:ATP-dependent exoDNAse (exonuclease V) alpha subunit
MEQAFDQAMSDLEVRWQTACKIFPDLVQTRKHLAKTAHRLAFAFVTLILETKDFNHRQQLADRLEQKFLELHFGTNQDIILLAKKLIALGHKKAIVALNEYVDVLGSNIDAKPLITKIYADFEINAFESEIQKSNEARQKSQHALDEAQIYLQSLRKYRKYWDAEYLLKLLGYEIEEIGQGIFKPLLINVYKKNQNDGRLFLKEFSSKGALVIWAIETIEL